jgi:hypothetical protein
MKLTVVAGDVLNLSCGVESCPIGHYRIVLSIDGDSLRVTEDGGYLADSRDVKFEDGQLVVGESRYEILSLDKGRALRQLPAIVRLNELYEATAAVPELQVPELDDRNEAVDIAVVAVLAGLSDERKVRVVAKELGLELSNDQLLAFMTLLASERLSSSGFGGLSGLLGAILA